MTQIAVVQPAAPRMPPASPQAASGSEQFSSHFEKAISSTKEQNKGNDTSQKTENPSKAENASPTIDETGKKSLPADSADQQADAGPADKMSGEGEEPVFPNGDESIVAQNPEQQFLLDLSSEENAAANAFFALPSDDAVPDRKPNGGGDATGQPPLSFAKTTDQPYYMPSPEAAKPASPQDGQKPAGDALLAQLQQIIANGDEKGTVTISQDKAAPPAPVDGKPTVTTAFWPQQTFPVNSNRTIESLQVVPAEGWSTPGEKTDPQAASQRQNTQQQYYEAKINLQSFDHNEESMPQERQQGNDSPAAQPQAATAATTPGSLVVDQANTFAQTVTTAQSTTLQPGSEAGKAVTLPSGTVVRDEEVIQQVMERFQITRKTLDTQINIKLHPAELGELKIDLTVKEGSIRANVVAQSQHAQEIIERNMTRLRGVLENHGFTVESITVSAKSDSTTNADLFDRQFFGRNEYTPQPSKRQHETEAAFRLDETFFPTQAATTGLNVKI